MLSACTLQSKHIQYVCEVRSVPASNPNRPEGGPTVGGIRQPSAPAPFRPRFPVVFAIKATLPAAPPMLPQEPVLSDPIIVSLTYFQTDVPFAPAPVFF
jgi:hypothetical protein